MDQRRHCVACDVLVPIKRMRRDVFVLSTSAMVIFLHCQQSAVCHAWAQGMAFWHRQRAASA